MLSADQIQLELQAIMEFDILFLAKSEHYPEEVVGFGLRRLRKQELLLLAESLASDKSVDIDRPADCSSWPKNTEVCDGGDISAPGESTMMS